MQTRVHEIAEGVYRLSTHVDAVTPKGFTFNQFLIVADEPMLFHCGQRAFFPMISEAVERLMPVAQLRWIGFGHVEADESGSMNAWLAAAPRAQVVHGRTACDVSLNDLADRPPRALASGEVLDLGGRRMRWIDTPHVPHGWEAGVFFEENEGMLFGGDLLTHGGDPAPVTEADIVDEALAFEAMSRSMSLGPATGAILRNLAALNPRTLALMHGSSFQGNGAEALQALAAWCEADQALAA
jgi:flavorubredoxin